MANCYLCGCALDADTDSREHVIPNAIGGRLRVRGLVCKKCNSELGSTIDGELTKQISPFCTFLNISRQEGAVQPAKGEGDKTKEPWVILPGGRPQIAKPEVLINVLPGDIEVSIKARSETEYREILKGIKRKYPEINIDDALKNPKWGQEWLDERVHFKLGIGGELAFRSVCKTAVNLYLYKGGDQRNATEAIDFIKNGGSDDFVMHYYPDKPVIEIDEPAGIGHTVIVTGNGDERLLYGYVEYVDSIRMLVVINEDYDGGSFEEDYSINVLTGEKRRVKSAVHLTKENLAALRQQPKVPNDRFSEALSKLLSKVDEKQVSEYCREATSEAIAESLGKYPEGEPITQPMVDELVRGLMTRISPLIRRRFFPDETEE